MVWGPEIAFRSPGLAVSACTCCDIPKASGRAFLRVSVNCPWTEWIPSPGGLDLFLQEQEWIVVKNKNKAIPWVSSFFPSAWPHFCFQAVFRRSRSLYRKPRTQLHRARDLCSLRNWDSNKLSLFFHKSPNLRNSLTAAENEPKDVASSTNETVWKKNM